MVLVPSGTNPTDYNSTVTIKTVTKKGVGIDDEGDYLSSHDKDVLHSVQSSFSQVL